jgi:DNA-binding XRE family transcriptional regulator
MSKSTDRVPPEVRDRAKKLHESLRHKPPLEELFTPEELADASPFYFTLRSFVAELKAARLDKGFTLAEVASRTGLAVETLSRLETGAIVNPTWQTLGKFAVAVGRTIRLSTEPAER